MQSNPTPVDPRDCLDKDEILLAWEEMKLQLVKLKEQELDMRKYIVKRAFPNAQEGMNTAPLGNGYNLKAGVKYNYTLDSDNDKVNAMLDKLAATGNDGSFIADRLVSWSPSFLLTEYRVLQKDAEEGNALAIERLKIISEVLTINDEAAPTLDIKAPKGK